MLLRTNENLPKTNNHVEGYHRGIQEALDGHHPTVFKLMKFLKKEENLQHQQGMQWIAGEPGRRNVEAERRAARLSNLVAERNQRNLLDYIRGITYNYNMS